MSRTWRSDGEQDVSSRPGEPFAGAWRVVAVREIEVKLRDRGLLLSVAVTLLAIFGSFVLSTHFSQRSETVSVAVHEEMASTVVAQAQRLAADSGVRLHIVVDSVATLESAHQAVRQGDSQLALTRTQDTMSLVGLHETLTPATDLLAQAYASLTMNRNASAAGLSTEELRAGAGIAHEVLEPRDANLGAQRSVSVILAMLFYFSSVMFGMTIAQSVVEEKQNRIIEILASAISTRALLAGKVVGNTVVAMVQIVLFVMAGLLASRVTGTETPAVRMDGAAVWFVVFFLFGFLALACLWAAVGSLASRSEELQASSTPLSVILLAVLAAAMFAQGNGLTVASYVPLANVVAMPSRMAVGEVEAWEPLLSLAGLALFTALVVVGAAQVYRRALLQTRGRLSVRQALRSPE